MKIVKYIMIFLMCSMLVIGQGCTGKIVNPNPDDDNDKPPPGQQPD